MLICLSMHKVPAVLAPVAGISSVFFEALVRTRNRSYESGLLVQHHLPAPVISVGNITMGGTGKTPLVIYLAQKLAALGLNPAVLTRGYRRHNSHESHILPPGKTVAAPSLTLGDEPALIRRHAPGAWMGIAKDRLTAGREILKYVEKPVFILDDGFQHRTLYRDLDIVIIDRHQPLKTNRLFPVGTLREPIAELCRCHTVIINGLPDTRDSPDPAASAIRTIHEKAAIFYCSQTICALIPFASWREGAAPGEPDKKPQSAYLAAAVGNPERFYKDVQQLGIEVRGKSFFPDHYWIKPDDWQKCGEEARAQAVDAIIITEKDAVKLSLPPDFPMRVAVQSTVLSDNSAFEKTLYHHLEERS